MIGFLKPRSDNAEFMEVVRERQALAAAYAERIEQALVAAGFPPNMLDELPSGHIAAALILGVK